MTMRDDATRVHVSYALPTLLAVACTAAGTGLGFVAPPLSRWAVETLPAVPGPLELLAELTAAWTVPILTAVGVVAGTALAATVVAEALALTVDSGGVLLDQNDDEL
ncbi:YqeB family protein [Rhodococcus phenolicus]|uniref:YqeB family protein n=1 Tax=Rhodococcus phenolicus TaxID=263849 RepID=UPI00083407DD|nr:hypothetical protein [Rhodococcus phenolicus]